MWPLLAKGQHCPPYQNDPSNSDYANPDFYECEIGLFCLVALQARVAHGQDRKTG